MSELLSDVSSYEISDVCTVAKVAENPLTPDQVVTILLRGKILQLVVRSFPTYTNKRNSLTYKLCTQTHTTHTHTHTHTGTFKQTVVCYIQLFLYSETSITRLEIIMPVNFTIILFFHSFILLLVFFKFVAIMLILFFPKTSAIFLFQFVLAVL